MKNLCYTIGYEGKDLNEFIDILRKNQINCVIDVEYMEKEECYREYNKENLKTMLNKIGIYHIFMGQEFRLDNRILQGGKVNNNREFKSAIDRILNGIKKGYTIAVMSRDKDPFKCLRGILISRQLQKHGIEMLHIIDKDKIQSQSVLEEEMVQKYGSKLVKRVAELSIRGIMNNMDLELNERDFKQEMVNEAYSLKFEEILKTHKNQ